MAASPLSILIYFESALKVINFIPKFLNVKVTVSPSASIGSPTETNEGFSLDNSTLKVNSSEVSFDNVGAVLGSETITVRGLI